MSGHAVTGSVQGPNGPIATGIEVRTIKGIVLPWEWVNPYDAQKEKRNGEAFIEWSVLDELAEQDVWRSQIFGAFLIEQDQGLALEQAGLAIHENRGGYHRTDELLALLKQEGRL